MSSSPVSNGLSPQLLDRYRSAKQRFLDISNVSRSGTQAASTLTGPTAIEPGSATPSCSGLRSFTNDDLLERLAKLATTPRGPDSAPLTTYRTTSTEHGEVYQATREYIDWLRRKIPGYGECGSVARPAPSSPAQSKGGNLDRFKPS